MASIAAALDALRLGEPTVHRNLAVFPLLGGRADRPPYDTLKQALDAGTVRVAEVSEGGSVPRLVLENRGERPVLLIDGEELVGAKQNRVLNLTILAAAGKLAFDGALLHLCAFNLPAQESRLPADDGGAIRRRRTGRRPPVN